MNIITKTVEINKLDTLKTDLEKLEYFVTSIESVDLKDTPDDFKIAFKDYCQEFRVALNAAKNRGYILSNNNEAIQNANKRLMDIYRSY